MRRELIVGVVAAAAASFVAAQQIAGFNVSIQQGEAHGCGEACRAAVNAGNVRDLGNIGVNFDRDFYATADNFTGSKPGDVLKLQAIDPTDRPFKGGTTAFRLQYTSVDLDGKLVPVTGFIVFPYAMPYLAAGGGDDTQGQGDGGGKGNGDGDANTRPPNAAPQTPPTKFRLAALAHGTLGIFTGCSASNAPNLFDYNSWQPLVSRGYAVVGTDYAGLGNNFTTHKYGNFNAHVADVYYSVVAARQLFGDVLTSEWIGIGHSQGGGTAWKLAESAFVRDDPAYLGTVALAPGTYIIETLFSDLDKLVAHPTYLPFIPEAVERTYPHYHETLLSETLRQRVALAKENQLCRAGMAGLMADLKGSFDGLVSVQGIERDLPTLLDWQNSMAPARGDRSPAPIFVLQGLNDTAVYAWATIKAVQHIFESGNEIHLALYPDVEHTPLLQVFELDWMGWTDSRFEAGKPKGSGKCSRVVRKAYNGKYVKLPAQR